MRSVPGIRLSDAALADLSLHSSGVRLPWRILGGSLAQVSGPVHVPASSASSVTGPRQTVGVQVGDDVDVTTFKGARLLLLDGQNAPVAALDDGVVTALEGTPPAAAAFGDDLVGAVVVIALRPWLAADASALGLDQPADNEKTRRVVVLVPSASTSPDGVPAVTLRQCVERSGFEVRTAPLVWRDLESDRALALAVGEALPDSRTVVLDPDDLEWRAAFRALSAGEPLPSGVLADGAASSLRQWRPPPQQRGLVVMFTGLSGSGKSTLAAALVSWLETNTDRTVTLLDGDIVRQHLSSGLGFDLISRDLNVRRIGYVASEIARHRGIAVCAPIAPFDASRKAVRAFVQPLGDFVLIHVATPLPECERRDRKGLYAKARAGLVTEFTGISSPYEAPADADLRLDTSEPTVVESLAQVLDLLRAGHWLPQGPT